VLGVPEHYLQHLYINGIYDWLMNFECTLILVTRQADLIITNVNKINLG